MDFLVDKQRKELVVMHSPKIDEDLVSVLYKMAKAEGRAMTRVVNEMIRKAVAKDTSPKTKKR